VACAAHSHPDGNADAHTSHANTNAAAAYPYSADGRATDGRAACKSGACDTNCDDTAGTVFHRPPIHRLLRQQQLCPT
jgi:hypothetical protein